MDSENEEFIMNNIIKHMQDKTILIISHKLNIINNMDKVMIIKDKHITLHDAKNFTINKEDSYVSQNASDKEEIT